MRDNEILELTAKPDLNSQLFIQGNVIRCAIHPESQIASLRSIASHHRPERIEGSRCPVGIDNLSVLAIKDAVRAYCFIGRDETVNGIGDPEAKLIVPPPFVRDRYTSLAAMNRNLRKNIISLGMEENAAYAIHSCRPWTAAVNVYADIADHSRSNEHQHGHPDQKEANGSVSHGHLSLPHWHLILSFLINSQYLARSMSA